MYVGRPYEKRKAKQLGVLPDIDVLVVDVVYHLYHKIVFVSLSHLSLTVVIVWYFA